MNWTAILFPLSLVVLVVPLLLGLRRRILVRMAFRNAQRRRRQSAMIVAGLMVGTAIIAGAQVAGDSMEYSIKKATLDAFEQIDETVFLDGYNFFPKSVATSLASDQRLQAQTDAVGSNILWDAAITDPRSSQYEPSARLVGFDPVADKIWGDFRDHGSRFDGTDLGANDVVLNQALADKLDAKVGDTLVLNYTQPQDPLIPTIVNVSGTLTTSATTPTPLPVGGGQTVQPYDVPLKVDANAIRLNVVVGWNPSGPVRQDLDAELHDPNGKTVASNHRGDTNSPDLPIFLFVNQTVAQPLVVGTWHLIVTGKAAAQTSFNGSAATFYAVYDLKELQARYAALAKQFPGFDPSDLGEPPRQTLQVHVQHITTGGKGPAFQLPNTLNLYLRLDALEKMLGREGQTNFVKVSNHGGVEDGVQHTAEVYPLLWSRLNETKRGDPNDASVQSLRAYNDKEFWLGQAEQLGTLFRTFLTFVGSFSIISGLLLIVNIFTMLAEERKVELAMARAVGLRRGHLIQLFLFEGILYALPAAAIGAFFGLGLARVLIWGFNAFNRANTFPPIPFRVEPQSLLFAFSVGILLTVTTVWLGARRASRLNIVAAIRNLEEPPHLKGVASLVWAALILSAGLAGTYFAVAANSFTWQLLGPTFLAIGVALLLRRVARKNRVYPFVAFALFAYLTIGLFVAKQPQTNEAQIIGPLRSVVMCLSVVIVVVYTERFAKLLGRVFSQIPALRAVALPAVSYPLHKKFRTGMTLAMFSVILLVVMLFSIVGGLFAPDIGKESGGYHVEAVSNLEFGTLQGRGTDPKVLDAVDHYDVLPYFIRYGADMVRINGKATGQFGPPANTVYGIDGAFAHENRFKLLQRASAYATDEAAYQAAAARPDLVVVSYEYSTDEQGRDGAFGVGDTLNLNAKGATQNFTIIGVQEAIHLRGVFISQTVVQRLFPNTDTLVLFRLKDPNDDEGMAKRIEANYKDLGLDANSIRLKVIEQNQSFRQIFTLIRLFLSLGLVVGILSLGIVTARSVIERRQEIGMMRALGYLRRHIRRTFLMEMLTTVTLGIAIGTLIAVIVSYAIWYSQVKQLRVPYTIPVLELLTIAFIAYSVTTLATLSPIFRAARTPPAEALRYIE